MTTRRYGRRAQGAAGNDSSGAAKVALLVAGGAAVGLALAGPAIVRNARRSRPHDDAPGRATHSDRFGAYDVVGRSVTIARPRNELYAYWREFRNLPQFMDNVEEVQPTGANGQSVWRIVGPGGKTLDVETEVVSDEADRLIAWRSVPGSAIDTEGRVEFHDAGQRGTKVTLVIAYKPPLGALGRLVAKASGREPEAQARHDLKRFKMMMETGEIATSQRFAGQETN